MAYEGRRGRRHKRRTRGRGVCTYCGRVHRKGKSKGSGNSCRGHTIKRVT